jgi:hypothetical protein
METNMELTFTQRFTEGLKQHDLTMIDMNDFVYSGGDNGSHLNYYKLLYNTDKLLPHKDYCICGHKIVKNCYIANGNQVLTLGICCIKRFISKEKQGRTCECCGYSHKNRKNNLCNKCREDRNKSIKRVNNKLINICMECGIDIDNFKYPYCPYCIDDIRITNTNISTI